MYDFLVIGGGISGASAAYELSAIGSVALLEAENAAGHHSTGRSAALFTGNYGCQVVRGLNKSSEPFFEKPPEKFTQNKLLTPRGALTVAPIVGQESILDALLDLSTQAAPIHRLSAAQAQEMAPLLRPERVAAAAYEPGVRDIDVAALHQGYLRGFKQNGGHIFLSHRVDKMNHTAKGWQINAGVHRLTAGRVINAAGAWADEIGALAGAAPIGLVPKRRTAIIIDAPQGMEIDAMPVVDFAGADSYIKPEAGKLMASPGDQTPITPQDVQPDEMDIAILVDWLERETTVSVRRIGHSWAGLRSFVADEIPVVGFDPKVPDLFWLAGQGGFGIMMAPALARVTVSLISGDDLPKDVVANGVRAEDLSPARMT